MRIKRGLQWAVVVLGLVPVLAGAGGLAYGLKFVEDATAAVTSLSADSHFRYLSGLLLAIGLAFWSTVPGIEHKGPLFRWLTFLVFVGGLGRAVSLQLYGLPPLPMIFGLVMELVVTPLLCLWQWILVLRLRRLDRIPSSPPASPAS